MPRRTLTALAAKNAKAKAKPYRLAAGIGLYLQVMPNGSKYWRLKYRVHGREKVLALGVYPEVSLEDARRNAQKARDQIRGGGDPSAQKRQARAHSRITAANSFEAVAKAWMAHQHSAEATATKNRWVMESFLFPAIGHRPIAEITPRELLDVLREIEKSGRLESAARVKMKAAQVYRYAIIEGIVENDPTISLRGALKKRTVKHHAAITDPARIGELMRAIEKFDGYYVTGCALKLSPLFFVRPGELRHAKWGEFDLSGGMWRIPGERMKMKAPHLVPLSKQAIAILQDLMELTGTGDYYVFPSVRSNRQPMSENTITAALRRMGYSGDEMTAHGFRSMAATRLNEMGWRADAIERQLAHAESNKVREAYTSAAQYLDERRKMMQAWSDYLDGLRTGAKVVPIRRSRAS